VSVSPTIVLALADALDALGKVASELRDAVDADALVSVAHAAKLGCTRPSVIRRAIASGALAGFGGERDRAVRVDDLRTWIESRRVKLSPTERTEADVEKRMREISKRDRAEAAE
jgi:hypothetical protein